MLKRNKKGLSFPESNRCGPCLLSAHQGYEYNILLATCFRWPGKYLTEQISLHGWRALGGATCQPCGGSLKDSPDGSESFQFIVFWATGFLAGFFSPLPRHHHPQTAGIFNWAVALQNKPPNKVAQDPVSFAQHSFGGCSYCCSVTSKLN